ncbi:MAG: DUF4292 domain-containing protein, partial [Muribaculaceae bacterium]|nr:DUF4292 domain-containing protein [Muribaculaceae bacterium]
PHDSSAPAAEEQTSPVAAIADTYGQWTDLKIPVKAELAKPKKFSASGTASMINGKAINVSFRLLGMEIAAAYADNDSVIVNIKPLGSYYAESISRFTSDFGLTLADLQSILLGRAFVPGKGQITSADAKAFSVSPIEGSEVMLTPKARIKNTEWFLTADLGDTPCVNGLAVEIKGHKPVLCNMTGQSDTPVGTIASRIQLRANIQKHDIDASLTLSPSKAEWDNNISIAKPRISKNAKRLSNAQILAILKKI